MAILPPDRMNIVFASTRGVFPSFLEFKKWICILVNWQCSNNALVLWIGGYYCGSKQLESRIAGSTFHSNKPKAHKCGKLKENAYMFLVKFNIYRTDKSIHVTLLMPIWTFRRVVYMRLLQKLTKSSIQMQLMFQVLFFTFICLFVLLLYRKSCFVSA